MAAERAGGAAGETLLRLEGVHAGYGEIEVLRGVSADVGAREIVSIIGANGAGKSTLLRTIAGLHRPTEGAIWFDGQDVTRVRPERRAARGIAIMVAWDRVHRRSRPVSDAERSVRRSTGKPGMTESPALDLDANATATTVVPAGQQSSRVVVRHVNHPCLVDDSGASTGIGWLVAARPLPRGSNQTHYIPYRGMGK